MEQNAVMYWWMFGKLWCFLLCRIAVWMETDVFGCCKQGVAIRKMLQTGDACWCRLKWCRKSSSQWIHRLETNSCTQNIPFTFFSRWHWYDPVYRQPIWVNLPSSRCDLITVMEALYMYLGSSVGATRSSRLGFYMHAGIYFFCVCAEPVRLVDMFQSFRKGGNLEKEEEGFVCNI